jgi:hypothetical protein
MAGNQRLHPTLAVLCLLVVALPTTAHAQVAVVVNRGNPITGLTLEQLRRLYLGKSTTFPGGTPVTLIESPAVRAGFYRQVLGMTHDQFKRHWVGVVFSGEGASPPREIEEVTQLRRFVSDHAAAVAFLPLGDVDTSVKVLTIDGAKPGDANYPLRGVTSDPRYTRAQ